ncbi:MAG: hypothetical protein FWD25_07115 [Clostridia bacterium]|nr:hypothetical protein [Clostridia bacterium]
MAKKILLDRSAAADVKSKLAEACRELSGSGIPALKAQSEANPTCKRAR